MVGGWHKVGYLPQEPELDETLDVLAVRVAATQGLLDEFEAISMRMVEPMDDDEMMKLLDRQGVLQDKIDAVNAWDLDVNLKLQWMPCEHRPQMQM